MKRYFISLALISYLLIGIQSYTQNFNKPVTINPLIGDKIDRVERDYFNLFPQFNGFQEAQYYLNTDSTVSVYIKYQDSGVRKDTLLKISNNLKTLVEKIDDLIRYKIKDGGLSEMNLMFYDGTEAQEHLFYVNDQYIFILNSTRNDYQNLHQDSNWLAYNYISINNIYRLGSIQSTPIEKYIGYGGLIGAVLGIVAGLIYTTSNREDYKGQFGGISQGTDVMYCMTIGIAVGTLTGLIIGLMSQEDIITIYPNSSGGLAELREYVLNSK